MTVKLRERLDISLQGWEREDRKGWQNPFIIGKERANVLKMSEKRAIKVKLR